MNTKHVQSDFVTMRELLDQLEKKLQSHVNKAEVENYYKPLKQFMFALWSDLCENGMPIAYTTDVPITAKDLLPPTNN